MTSLSEPTLQPAVQISNLSVSKADTEICHVSNAQIDRRRTVAIRGPNGSGKSTLLRVLAGLETRFSGECMINFALKDRVFVHQSPFLFSGTVLNNVEYGLRARGIARPVRRKEAAAWLERFGIAHLATRSVQSLSGGERRRTALARACVLQPRLLLLDEPLSDLDPEGIDSVIRALGELTDSTILISSPSSLPAGIAQDEITIEQVST